VSGDILAQLMRQGAERGADLVTLRAIAEEAGELAATRAIERMGERLGLSDAGAGGDVRELRELLGAWRDARRSAWTAVFGWVARAAAALLLAGWAIQGWATGGWLG